jgi:Mn-dependent DtxR family transcriptional regulator
MTDVRSETLHRLAELGLAHYEHPGWTLTPAGQNLFPRLLNGDGPELL